MCPDKNLEVACPGCKKKVLWKSSKFRPFCSERCRERDLGNWASDQYTVPGESISENDPTNPNGFHHEEE